MNGEAHLSSLKAQLSAAVAARKTIAIAGAGTKAGWGSIAPAADVTISTRALSAVVEHRYGDLTATVQAGATLADVNRTLAAHGQWIALDPPWSDRATIGGILATNDSGPRRHRFGSPRDNVIGIEIVRVDGTAARAGGIVVKNVAGYDLGRLMAGSFGSLAVIASATFKLYPIPPASRTVIVSGERFGGLMAALLSSHLTPTALELQIHPLRLLVRFESIEAAAEQQAERTRQLAEEHGGVGAVVGADEEEAIWAAHAQRPWGGSGAVLKATLLPTDLAPTLAWLEQTLGAGGWDAIGRAGVGALLLSVDGDAAHQARLVAALRARLAQGRGSVVIVRGSDELKRTVDVWGPSGDALPVMKAIKRQFDPDALLNPGRGPFGI